MICIALCWCLHFEKQILLPVMIAWLQQLKSLCLFSGLRGLPPELLPCLVGTGYKAIAGSAVRLMVGMLVLRAWWAWILSGPWVNGTTSGALLSRVALE